MKQFVAVYFGSEKNMLEEWSNLPENVRKEREQAGIAAWKGWVEKNEKSIVGMGSPLGKTKRIDKKGVSDMKNEITAYTIVRAESHDAAAKLFLNHPHFAIFPGDHVEIMECLPIPGM